MTVPARRFGEVAGGHFRTAARWFAAAAATLWLWASPVIATAAEQDHAAVAARQGHSLSDTRFSLPDQAHVARVLLLRDHSTRIVAGGTVLLGICGGVVGTFMLLRRRSLIGDVVSHASLPGVAGVFILLEAVQPDSGRSTAALLAGATVAGVAGVVCVVAIRKFTRIQEDAALAIVLSVFFGMGIALFTVVQNLSSGSTAGLQHFIFGRAASMVTSDVQLIAQASCLVLAVCVLLLKEFSLLCFDEDFASAQGWPVVGLDLVLMGLVVAVSVIGLQSVGLLLVVATLIIPAAAARFWTDYLPRMTLISAGIGGAAAMGGVMVSALFPRWPTGAVIVLAGTLLFLISMFCGSRRGVLQRIYSQWRLRRRTTRQHLLRAMFEILELQQSPKSSATERNAPSAHQRCAMPMPERSVAFDRLFHARSWSRRTLNLVLRSAERSGLIHGDRIRGYELTDAGRREAGRIVRNHRLWELFLIHHADIAPSHVDRDADMIEHVLEPALIAELESQLLESDAKAAAQEIVPRSPHSLSIQN